MLLLGPRVLAQRGIQIVVVGPVLLWPAPRSVHIRRVHHVLLLHLQADIRIISALARKLPQPRERLRVYPGDVVDAVGGDVGLGEGQGLDADGEGVVADLEDLGRFGVGEAEEGFGTFEKGGRVGGLFGDAGFQAGFFHGVEVLVAGEEVDALARGVLRHLFAAVLAADLGEFLGGLLVGDVDVDGGGGDQVLGWYQLLLEAKKNRLQGGWWGAHLLAVGVCRDDLPCCMSLYIARGIFVPSRTRPAHREVEQG